MLLNMKRAVLCGNFEGRWQTNLHGSSSRIQAIISKERGIVITEDNQLIKAGSFKILERTIESIQKYEIWKQHSRSMSLLQIDNVWTKSMVFLGWRLFGSWQRSRSIESKGLIEVLDCDDVGNLLENVGCKVNYDQEVGTVRLTQPVIIQSFQGIKHSSNPWNSNEQRRSQEPSQH
jgi:hypothetical protein